MEPQSQSNNTWINLYCCELWNVWVVTFRATGKPAARKITQDVWLVPGLWKHDWHPVQLTLVVDDLWLKYVREEHTLYLKIYI
jgi:hypothetical protein